MTKPQLPGAAEWTHRPFDASFNPVSTDTAFATPTMTQCLGTPYNHGAGAPRIAGSRLLMVMEGQYNSRPYCDVDYLYVRDAYNGQILWRRDLGTQYAADFYLSACVATAEAVYLIDMPKPVVLVLDPETGRELRKLDCSSLGKMVKWIAYQDGVLYVAAGELDRTGGPWNGVYGAMHVKFVRDNTDSLTHSVQAGSNRVIAALDPKTGDVLWRHEEDRDCIPEYLISARKSRLSFLAQDKYAR